MITHCVTSKHKPHSLPPPNQSPRDTECVSASDNDTWEQLLGAPAYINSPIDKKHAGTKLRGNKHAASRILPALAAAQDSNFKF